MRKKEKHKIVLTDKNRPEESVEISLIDGVFAITKVVKTETRDLILTEKNI